MDDTWAERDLPVLRAIVAVEEESGRYAQVDDLARRTGLAEDQVQRAIGALNREIPPLIAVIDASTAEGTYYAGAGDATGEARRRVGAWPTPEALVDRLVEALNRAADQEPDAEKQGRIRQVAQAFGGGMRDVAVHVAGTALARSVGL